ncbi:MAG: micrococcal nuclease [Clostridiales bacterium]|jgi:micrococcal nuclease|nr:micrococcal nuclease [Clostridiales bacterium]
MLMTKKQFTVFLILIALILAGSFGYQVWRTPEGLDGPYAVERVVDGDTIVVRMGADAVKVRMIGIDTPESVHSDPEKNTPEGEAASEYVKAMLTDEKVYLAYDVGIQDRYGRTLAYVYLADGKTMVNLVLIQEGYALTMTIPPNTQYADIFYAALLQARADHKGFWETGFFSLEE